MANFNITIPDELLPAIEAEYSLVQGSTMATNAQEYFAASVVETVRQRAELYKVGPYYVGPINPQFNQDGTPFGPPVQIVEEEIIPSVEEEVDYIVEEEIGESDV